MSSPWWKWPSAAPAADPNVEQLPSSQLRQIPTYSGEVMHFALGVEPSFNVSVAPPSLPNNPAAFFPYYVGDGGGGSSLEYPTPTMTETASPAVPSSTHNTAKRSKSSAAASSLARLQAMAVVSEGFAGNEDVTPPRQSPRLGVGHHSPQSPPRSIFTGNEEEDYGPPLQLAMSSDVGAEATPPRALPMGRLRSSAAQHRATKGVADWARLAGAEVEVVSAAPARRQAKAAVSTTTAPRAPPKARVAPVKTSTRASALKAMSGGAAATVVDVAAPTVVVAPVASLLTFSPGTSPAKANQRVKASPKKQPTAVSKRASAPPSAGSSPASLKRLVKKAIAIPERSHNGSEPPEEMRRAEEVYEFIQRHVPAPVTASPPSPRKTGKMAAATQRREAPGGKRGGAVPPSNSAPATVASNSMGGGGSTRKSRPICLVFDTCSLLESDPGVLNLVAEKWLLAFPFTVLDELDSINKGQPNGKAGAAPPSTSRKGKAAGADSAERREWRARRAREVRDWIRSALIRMPQAVLVQRRAEVVVGFNRPGQSNDDSILGFAVFLKNHSSYRGTKILFITEDKILSIKAMTELGKHVHGYAEVKRMVGVK